MQHRYRIQAVLPLDGFRDLHLQPARSEPGGRSHRHRAGDERCRAGQWLFQALQRHRRDARRHGEHSDRCRPHRELHRPGRARHHEPRYLRHRRSVRPRQTLDRHPAPASVERQDTPRLRRQHRPAAPAGPPRHGLDQRGQSAVARLHVCHQQPHGLGTQLEPCADERDRDDAQGACFRYLWTDPVHDGPGLLGRLDQLPHERVDQPGAAGRRHHQLRLSRLGNHRDRSGRLRAVGRGLPKAAVVHTHGHHQHRHYQRQEKSHQRPPGPDRLPRLVQRLRQQRQGRAVPAAHRAGGQQRHRRAGAKHRDHQQLRAAQFNNL